MNRKFLKCYLHQIDTTSGECYPFSMKIERIIDIRKRFKNQWLLIGVDEVDPKTHEPAKGHLLAHGARRQDVHKMSKKYDDVAYVVYSEDWPDDLAACFIVQ